MKNASHKASHLSRTSTISCSMRLLRGGSSSRRSRSAWLRVCKMCSVSISLFDTGGCMHDFGRNSAGLHDVMIFQGGMYQKHQGRFPQLAGDCKGLGRAPAGAVSSEERRVGKECVST